MKLSKYSTKIIIDDRQEMIYNTRTRQYYVYDKDKVDEVWGFINNINKGSYTEKEINLFQELLSKGIIYSDSGDELDELRYHENTKKYCDSSFQMIVFATNACNFRCTYCVQDHAVRRLEDSVTANILRLIDKKAQTAKKINIVWFGGEPLLEFDKIQQILFRAREICDRSHCGLTSSMITNGYLLDDNRIECLKGLGLGGMQITVDGNQVTHDARRKLADGRGTYEQVLTNIIKCLEHGIYVTLRINVDEENGVDISKLLEAIPCRYRSLIKVSISNIFQNKQKVDAFGLVKQVIDKNYLQYDRHNFSGYCLSCLKNSVTIDTDGKVLLCTYGDKKELHLGYLDSKGNIQITEKGKLYRMNTVSAINNPQCRECIELPLCLSGCSYARMKNNTACMGKRSDGMTLEECALLDYYYDRKKEMLGLQSSDTCVIPATALKS